MSGGPFGFRKPSGNLFTRAKVLPGAKKKTKRSKKDAHDSHLKEIVTLCIEALEPWQESSIIRAEMSRAIAQNLIKLESKRMQRVLAMARRRGMK
jgi:hypothetical protein